MTIASCYGFWKGYQFLSGGTDILQESWAIPPTKHSDYGIFYACTSCCCSWPNSETVPSKLRFGIPAVCNAALTCCVTVTFVSEFPFLNLKNGPGSTPKLLWNSRLLVQAIKGSQFCQFNKRIYSLSKLYRFVPFKCTWIRVWGDTGLSFATSSHARCFFWSKADRERVGVPTLSACDKK